MSNFFSVPAIDSHAHMEAWPDLAYMRGYRARFGFDAVSIACINPRAKDPTANPLAAVLKLEDPHFYAHAGLVYPEFPVRTPVDAACDFAAQAREFAAIHLVDPSLSCLNILEITTKLVDKPAVSISNGTGGERQATKRLD